MTPKGHKDDDQSPPNSQIFTFIYAVRHVKLRSSVTGNDCREIRPQHMSTTAISATLDVDFSEEYDHSLAPKEDSPRSTPWKFAQYIVLSYGVAVISSLARKYLKLTMPSQKIRKGFHRNVHPSGRNEQSWEPSRKKATYNFGYFFTNGIPNQFV